MARPKEDLKTPPMHMERMRFPLSLLSESALDLSENTTYEEICSVGFHPQLDALHAVVYIKQAYGYSGGLCSDGSPEFVRFYLTYDGGATWIDQGMTEFTAHDTPGVEKRPLEYAVTHEIQPQKRWCSEENLPVCRAILSWYIAPPPGDPTWTPPWGNVHDTVIQIDRRPWFILAELFKEWKIELPESFIKVVDLEQKVPVLPPMPLSVSQLGKLYADKKVEPKRFGFPAALKLLANKPYMAELAEGVKGPIADIEINFPELFDELDELEGDTSYEELECVGLNPDMSSLIATFRIKRSSGYSGDLCDGGSTEYVTFWGDFDMDGSFERCLGTAQVQVYDFDSITPTGLEYAVSLPVDLNPYRKPCSAGPQLARIRAILSWASPHSCADPDEAPRWGNAEDTVILIPPGPEADPEKQHPYIWTLCNRNVCTIDQATGESNEKPFGGTINIAGEFLNATLPGFFMDRFKYKIEVRPRPAGAWQTVDGQFKVWVTEGSGSGIPWTHRVTQSVDANGYFTYLEYGTPATGNWRRVTGPNRLLAPWRTSSDDVGLWEIKITGYDTLTGLYWVGGTQECPDGTFRQNVIVKLDQERPDVAMAITGYKKPTDAPADPPTPAGDCDTFKKGWVIHGTYDVSDEHFRRLKFSVLPAAPAHGAAVNPSSRSYPVVPTIGESGNWTLDTAPMDPCGYVVLMEAWDRTIASCDGDGWYNRVSVGFCLEE